MAIALMLVAYLNTISRDFFKKHLCDCTVMGDNGVFTKIMKTNVSHLCRYILEVDSCQAISCRTQIVFISCNYQAICQRLQ